MAKSSTYGTGRRCVFALHVDVVLMTKYRWLVFTKEILEDLRTIFSDVCQDFENTLEEFDGCAFAHYLPASGRDFSTGE